MTDGATDVHNPWWTDWYIDQGNSPYGPILGGTAVQEAVYNTLAEWLPSYIAETNRQLGAGILADNIEYRHRPEFRTLPKNVVCAILVLVPGTQGTPQNYQEFTRANWRGEIDAFIYGTKDWQETQALTNAYAACIRSCVVQHRDLNQFAETTKWMGENYYEGEHSSTRTTGLAKINFEVTVGNNVTPFGGAPNPLYAPTGAPTTPVLTPLPQPPDVTATDITVGKEN